jgi:cytoskeletal protein RodZ
MTTECRDCGITHSRPEHPEFSEPRRETLKDFALALGTWGLVVAAYVMGGIALWSLTQP